MEMAFAYMDVEDSSAQCDFQAVVRESMGVPGTLHWKFCSITNGHMVPFMLLTVIGNVYTRDLRVYRVLPVVIYIAYELIA